MASTLSAHALDRFDRLSRAPEAPRRTSLGDGVPVLESLPPRVREAVADRAIVRRFSRGAPICWQGDRLRHLPLVVTGHVKLMRNTEGGREVVADLIGPGDTPCWPEVLADEPLPLSMLALEDCEVALLPPTPVLHCISTDPRVGLAYAQMLAGQYHTLLDQLAETRAPSVPARLGGLLLHLLSRRGDRGSGVIPVRMTRQDLADAAGTTVETAIRLMRKWEKAGIVETRRDGIHVRDAEGLRDAADGTDA